MQSSSTIKKQISDNLLLPIQPVNAAANQLNNTAILNTPGGINNQQVPSAFTPLSRNLNQGPDRFISLSKLLSERQMSSCSPQKPPENLIKFESLYKQLFGNSNQANNLQTDIAQPTNNHHLLQSPPMLQKSNSINFKLTPSLILKSRGSQLSGHNSKLLATPVGPTKFTLNLKPTSIPQSSTTTNLACNEVILAAPKPQYATNNAGMNSKSLFEKVDFRYLNETLSKNQQEKAAVSILNTPNKLLLRKEIDLSSPINNGFIVSGTSTSFSSAMKEQEVVPEGSQDESVGSVCTKNSTDMPVDNSQNNTSNEEEIVNDNDLIEGVIMNNKVLISGHIICDLLVSDNLNECVDALLKKQKPQRTDAMGVIMPQVMVRHKSSLRGKGRLRRIRKNSDQYKILNNEYLKQAFWSKEYIKRLSKRLGLKQSQIYKWNWDQRKKDGLVRTEEEQHF